MREVEIKFRVHGPFRIPELAGEATGVTSVDAHGTTVLKAAYYDTADLRLAREGITLRLRSGGKDAGWHLKIPEPGSGKGTREEIQRPAAGAAPPPELRELVTAWVRHEQLAAVATLRTERTTSMLLDEAGGPLAELVDDVVSVLDGRQIAAKFREIEVEAGPAAADPDAVLERIGAVLAAAGAVPGEFVPKAVRALGSRATAAPEPPLPEPAGPDDPARDAVVAHLRTHVRAFMAQDPRVRLDASDAVHQMRVAARRLRSGLRTFGPLLDPAWSADLQDQLRWIADVLGGVRDREVLHERLLHQLQELPAGVVADTTSRDLDRMLTDGLADARALVLQELRGDRYLSLIDALVAAATDPPTTPAADEPARQALPPLVRAAWRQLDKRVGKLDDDAPDALFHSARIAAKRARYAGELCTPVFGAPAKAFAAAVATVQEVLGDHQDAAVAQEVLRDLAARRGVRGSTGFALGVLHERQQDVLEETRAQFFGVWKSVRPKRHRRWLAD